MRKFPCGTVDSESGIAAAVVQAKTCGAGLFPGHGNFRRSWEWPKKKKRERERENINEVQVNKKKLSRVLSV